MLRHITEATKATQREPIVGREADMTKNNAGGYVFSTDTLTRVRRFLILGSEGGTYYASERDLTRENLKALNIAATNTPKELIELIVSVSTAGRAPKNDYALYALAVLSVHHDAGVRAAALRVLPKVARIPTHLFTFLEYRKALGGKWGRSLRRAISDWYNNSPSLAYHLVKYCKRGGWSHRDVLRLAHPTPASAEVDDLFKWAVGKWPADVEHPNNLIRAHQAVNGATSDAQVVDILNHNPALPRGAIPTTHLTPRVWKALLPNMPLMALVRNLATMTANGTLVPLSPDIKVVCEKLTNKAVVRNSRIHPIQALTALKTYRKGQGERGRLTWEPIPQITSDLEALLYLSFGNVAQSNRRMLLAIDVSASMSWSTIGGTVNLTPFEAAGAMAMVTTRSCPNYYITAFSHTMQPCDITATDSIDIVFEKLRSISMGGTDCAAPIQHAFKNRLLVDAFVIYTDNETWHGDEHPCDALHRYRARYVPDAKLITVGMTSNGFTIADPTDRGMLDVVGFDTATPNIITDFVEGKI